MSDKQWLDGYYDPSLVDDWEELCKSWSTGPHAGADWFWVDKGYYTHEEIKAGHKAGKFELKGVSEEQEQ